MTSDEVEAERRTLRLLLSVATRPALESADAALAPTETAKSIMTVAADIIKILITFFIMSFLFSFGRHICRSFSHSPFLRCVAYMHVYYNISGAVWEEAKYWKYVG